MCDSRVSDLLEGEDVSGVCRGHLVVGRVGQGVGQRHQGVVVRLDLEFLRLVVGCDDRRDGHFGRHDLQLLQRRVRVNRPAKGLHVLGADLGEVPHGLDVLTAGVSDALKAAVGKGHVVLSRLLRLVVLELVRRAYSLGLGDRVLPC